MRKCLSGKRILVTRPLQQSEALADLIDQNGGTAVMLPLIKTTACEENRRHYTSLVKQEKCEWIIFTSANAVFYFEKALEAEKVIFNERSFQIAAIGPKTNAALAERGWHVDLLPETYVAESLAEKLIQQVKPGETVLFPKSRLARDVIPAELRAMGLECVEWPLYETIPEEENRDSLKSLVAEGGIDIITFMSPSAVKVFISFMDPALPRTWKALPVVAVGPVTAEEARLFHQVYTAAPHSIEGMLTQLCSASSKEDN
ncbi:uroporphyrinogen-III synthase [Alteribacillus sp. HJP-4]|uniref:uroporphyrinogen-III synthase n=1 Tax=Alteribacillus sp. HJP-4 TaxID=2775394 RepID=UPI0035CCEB2C